MKLKKPLIDVNRLNYLIKKGQDSYCDGRESFTYELLRDLMERLGVKIREAPQGPHSDRVKHYKHYSNTWSEWMLIVTSTYDYTSDDYDENEQEPHHKGVHVDHVYQSAKAALKALRRKKNTHFETWSLKLIKKTGPNLP